MIAAKLELLKSLKILPDIYFFPCLLLISLHIQDALPLSCVLGLQGDDNTTQFPLDNAQLLKRDIHLDRALGLMIYTNPVWKNPPIVNTQVPGYFKRRCLTRRSVVHYNKEFMSYVEPSC